MSTFRAVTEAIRVCRKAIVTPCLWGVHGLGKSSLVKQITENGRMGFIDMRLSQIEPSDIRGLPYKTEDGRTGYCAPVDMPSATLSYEDYEAHLDKLKDPYERLSYIKKSQSKLKEGYLFLDEINRAGDDVLQCAFQLVLDRCVGEYVLPPGWSIIAACNFSSGYIVNQFNDPAFVSRFCHLTLGTTETMDEWVQYMHDLYQDRALNIIEYVSQDARYLDPKNEADKGFEVGPNRRNWEAFTRIQDIIEEEPVSKETRRTLMAGLLGEDIAITFDRDIAPISAKDVVDKGVEYYKDILDTLHRGHITGIMWGMTAICRERLNDDRIAGVCIDYIKWLLKHTTKKATKPADTDDETIAEMTAPETEDTKDIAVAFCRALVNSKRTIQILGESPVINDVLDNAMQNDNMAELISKREKNNDYKGFITRMREEPEIKELLEKVVWE